MSRARTAIVVAAFAAVLPCWSVPADASTKLPKGWPRAVHLGAWNRLGDAPKLRKTARFRFRYEVLSGGVNTGRGWANYSPGGSFVSAYAQESARYRMIPVFTYYMLRQSRPGADIADEPTAVLENLQTKKTMKAYFTDLRLFFKRARATRRRMVLHVEPDLWGYVQQRSPTDDASSVYAEVASTGLRELKGLPNSVTGFAQAVRRLRNRYARKVTLAYHLTVWGTRVDIPRANPSAAEVDALGRQAAAFYRSLLTRFDLVFAEFDNRDAGYREAVFGDGGGSWWDPNDYVRNTRFLRIFSKQTGRRIVLWRIPLGNTVMRTMDNSFGHYQDNRVEWLLAGRRYRHLGSYRDAGVVAFIFGSGLQGNTCACDAQFDGVTNPDPINGNKKRSRSSDDDGGYFRQRARSYYKRRPLRLRR